MNHRMGQYFHISLVGQNLLVCYKDGGGGQGGKGRGEGKGGAGERRAEKGVEEEGVERADYFALFIFSETVS